MSEHDTTETWKPIVGAEGRYEVSSLGRVRSLPREKTTGGILKQHANRKGYLRVTISRNGKGRTRNVHVLVAQAFHGPKPFDGAHVRHLNGNPADNRAENLRWGTVSENTRDTIEHGNHKQLAKTHCPKGHEYAGDNLIVTAWGSRWCRACRNTWSKGRAESLPCPRCDREFSRLDNLRRHLSDVHGEHWTGPELRAALAAAPTPPAEAESRRCTWGQIGLPSCRSGVRGDRYWCEQCRADLSKAPDCAPAPPAEVACPAGHLEHGSCGCPTPPAEAGPRACPHEGPGYVPGSAFPIDRAIHEHDRVTRVLIDAWERAERKRLGVTHIATFADMGRAILDDRAELPSPPAEAEGLSLLLAQVRSAERAAGRWARENEDANEIAVALAEVAGYLHQGAHPTPPTTDAEEA